MGTGSDDLPIPAADGIEIDIDRLYLLVCPDCGEQVNNLPLGNEWMCFCMNPACQPRAIVMTPGEPGYNHVTVLEGVAGQRALVEAAHEYEREDVLKENLRNQAGWRRFVDAQEARLKTLEADQ